MRVFKNGAPAGTAADIDLREGAGISLTVSDESGANGATAVTIATGGSLPAVLTSVSRDVATRVIAFVNSAGSYTVTYDNSTGLVKTISDGTTTRTISRDASGLVTGVS